MIGHGEEFLRGPRVAGDDGAAHGEPGGREREGRCCRLPEAVELLARALEEDIADRVFAARDQDCELLATVSAYRVILPGHRPQSFTD